MHSSGLFGTVTLDVYGGICGTTIPTGTVNTSYSEPESFVIFSDCFDAGLVEPSLAGRIVKIQSVNSFSFSNLPAGLNAATNQPN